MVYPVKISSWNTTIYHRRFCAVGIDDEYSINIDIAFGLILGNTINKLEVIAMSCVDLKGKTILVTGAAGFIGNNLVKSLYNNVEDVTAVGIDNMNDYYDVRLKEA